MSRLALFVAMLCVGPGAAAQPSVSLGADVVSRYVWRGIDYGDQVNLQPSLAVSFGTLSMLLEPGASAYEAILHREAARGRFVALDPNIRADLVADPDAYRERFRSWLPSLGLLKLSEEDAEWLAGDSADLGATVRDWQRRGPSAVVLTRGAGGLAVLAGDGEWVEVTGAEARVVDTLGAGDTVQAALLAWLHGEGVLSAEAVRGLDRRGWERALRFAADAAAITVSRAGAEPPFADELGSAHSVMLSWSHLPGRTNTIAA